MKSKSEFPQALKKFAKEVGLPPELICDHSGEQTSKEARAFLNKIGSTLNVLERGTQKCNLVELYIGLIKRSTRQDMLDAQSPLVLWDHCVERRAKINNLTARDLFQLQGQTPHTKTFGEVGDISNLCRLGWYEWCYYFEDAAFPVSNEMLGRCLGPADNFGNEMTQNVLTRDGEIIPRRTLRPLTKIEMDDPAKMKDRESFDAGIKEKLGTCYKVPENNRRKGTLRSSRNNNLSVETVEEDKAVDAIIYQS